MEISEILALVSRWLHIIPAILLTGGILFMRFALVPAVTESGDSAELRESIRGRWSKLVMISVLFGAPCCSQTTTTDPFGTAAACGLGAELVTLLVTLSGAFQLPPSKRLSLT